MKKLIMIALAVVVCHTALFAQKPKEVPEKDVTIRYVKDFQSKAKDATNVKWYKIDSLTYRAVFTDADGDPQALLFNNKGFETHYIIRPEHYTSAIKDTVRNQYRGYNINEVYIRKVKGAYSYQVKISKRTGFLWWKKESNPVTLNFDTSGKFLNEE